MVKIRLTRMGKKKHPFYRIVAVNSRSGRDSAYIEELGYYNPMTKPSTSYVKPKRIMEWLLNGAQLSNTVEKILEKHSVVQAFNKVKSDDELKVMYNDGKFEELYEKLGLKEDSKIEGIPESLARLQSKEGKKKARAKKAAGE